MKAPLLYRVAAVLLVLFALGHQLGFRKGDPKWNAGSIIGTMKTQIMADGFPRSYWHFFSGFGFFVTCFLLFSAVLSWDLSHGTGSLMVRWAFATCYVAVAIISWAYFFIIPGVFATLVALALLLAAAI